MPFTCSTVMDALSRRRRARAVAIDGRRLLPYALTPLAARLGRCL